MIENGRQEEAARLIERWKTVQDSLFRWKISPGTSSREAQWLLAASQGNEERKDELEREIASVPGERRFRLVMKDVYIQNQYNLIRIEMKPYSMTCLSHN
jgi:hypothetical protein